MVQRVITKTAIFQYKNVIIGPNLVQTSYYGYILREQIYIFSPVFLFYSPKQPIWSKLAIFGYFFAHKVAKKQKSSYKIPVNKICQDFVRGFFIIFYDFMGKNRSQKSPKITNFDQNWLFWAIKSKNGPKSKFRFLQFLKNYPKLVSNQFLAYQYHFCKSLSIFV